MKKFFVVFNLMFICSLSFAGLSVNPSIANISGIQGSSCKNAYSVTSSYEEPVTVEVSLSNGNSFSGNGDLNVEDWLKFEKKEFDLQPGETAEVPYEVFISTNMKGSVCGRVDFSTQQSAMINLSISVPVYVVVEGTDNISFNIESLDISKSPRDGNYYYKMTIKNTGNVHIRHSGKIQIRKSGTKKELKNMTIEETVPTYCEQSRDFNGLFLSQKEMLEDGKYVAKFIINDFGKEATRKVKFRVKNKEITVLKNK